MTPLEFIGAISIGALSIVLLLFGWVAYLARGHRIDLTQVRAINVWEDLNRRKAFGPWRTVEKDADVKLPEPGLPAEAFDGVLRGVRIGREYTERTQHGAKTREVEGGDL